MRSGMHWMAAPLMIASLSFLALGCPGAGQRPESEAPETKADPLRIEAMVNLRDRIEVARLRSQMDALSAELEGAATSGDPWAVIAASMVQLRSDADKAWNRLREVVAVLGDRGPECYWAHLGMAEVYLVWKVPGQAQGEVDAALRLYPGSAPALSWKGRVALARKATAEARRAFEAALAAGGAARAPFAAMALARLLRGEDAARARTLVDGVLAAYPDLVEALLLAADLRGPGPERTAFLERAARRAPESGELGARLAEALEAEGRGDAALEAWKATAEAHPSRLDAWQAVARLAHAAGEGKSERRALEEVARLDPKEVDALVRLAELRAADEDLEGAEAAWDEVLARRKDDASAYLARGKVREAREAYRLAMADYRAAKARGLPAAEAAIVALSEKLHLPSKPVRGKTPQAVFRRVARLLGPVYEAHLKTSPQLGGTLAVRVVVEDGAVVEAEIQEDSLHDPILEGMIYWTVHDAGFPRKKGRQEYTLPFTFDPADYAK